MPRKQPAAAPAAAPAANATRSASPNAGKKRVRVNRADYKYAVWVGNGRSPKFFANSKDEIHEKLKQFRSSQRDNVTIGELKQAVAETVLKF
jgi:DNA-binding protein H-NS